MTFSFGGFGSQPTAQPAAGGISFGQPAASSAAPLFGGGGGFGTQTTSQAPSATGFSFGSPAVSSAAPTFGGFGATTSQAPGTSTGFSFGQPAAASSGFGGGFGTTMTTTSAPSTGFSFGQPAQQQQQQQQTSFGFGAPAAPASTAGFSFGQTSAAPSFGSFSFSTPSQQPGQQPSMFGQSLFGQQQPQQQQQQVQQGQIDESQALHQSIFQVSKFGDERDKILAQLNYLQACWGCGKGYYSQAFPPVTYTPSNPFYRFKAVGYAYIFTDNNEDGNVALTIKKPQAKLEAEETQLTGALQNMIARPNIMFKITGMKPQSEEVTQVVLHAEDKSSLRRIPATDLVNFLSQPHLKPQLDNLGVIALFPKVRPSPEQIQRYLDNPPDGIDPRVWRKAQEDNPDPVNMIPTPMIGLESLKTRISWQQSESQQHHIRLNMISEEITNFQNRHSNINAELQQLRRKHGELSHRVLSIIVRQEMHRKQGMTIQAEEEQLKEQLEKLNEELNSPTQFKGRLNELLSQIRLRKAENEMRGSTRYTLEPTELAEIKEFLTMQQDSIKHLVDTTKTDSETVKAIVKSATEMVMSKKK